MISDNSRIISYGNFFIYGADAFQIFRADTSIIEK